MPEVTVNGVEIEVSNGATVLQACELAGKEIPRYLLRDAAVLCYPRLAYSLTATGSTREAAE